MQRFNEDKQGNKEIKYCNKRNPSSLADSTSKWSSRALEGVPENKTTVAYNPTVMVII